MLIQKRAKENYHSGGLWSNACCGHQITQDLLYEAQKRLFEELGIVCKLRDLFRFHYNEVVSSSMIENETDDVLIGFVNSYDIYPNPEEIEKVLIPIADDKIQRKITEVIKESFRLRAESKALLEKAKKSVELAIETSEKKAVDLLNLTLEC